jgi:hypothetical protein
MQVETEVAEKLLSEAPIELNDLLLALVGGGVGEVSLN